MTCLVIISLAASLFGLIFLNFETHLLSSVLPTLVSSKLKPSPVIIPHILRLMSLRELGIFMTSSSRYITMHYAGDGCEARYHIKDTVASLRHFTSLLTLDLTPRKKGTKLSNYNDRVIQSKWTEKWGCCELDLGLLI